VIFIAFVLMSAVGYGAGYLAARRDAQQRLDDLQRRNDILQEHQRRLLRTLGATGPDHDPWRTRHPEPPTPDTPGPRHSLRWDTYEGGQ
jgi:hypothetical protein